MNAAMPSQSQLSPTPATPDAVPVLLGFDFLGSENIGDDLMFNGFLRSIDALGLSAKLSLTGTSSHHIASQRARFPKVEWAYRPGTTRQMLFSARPYKAWVGVGDTPFQYALGPGSLSFMEEEIAALDPSVSCVLVNVGAESEIEPVADRFATLMRRFDRITTRDEHTYKTLVEMVGIPAEKVTRGADLAHVSLAELYREQPPRRRHRFGIIVAADTMAPDDLIEIKRFLIGRRGLTRFIAGDSSDRPYCERATYRWIGSRPWSPIRFKARLDIPDYHNGSLADLVRPIADCETLISSRYHGLMVGAWAGCRVAAISRSSKVWSLADELGIPFARLPIRVDDLVALEDRAVVVPRERLLPFREQAIRGVSLALEGIV